MSVVSSDADRAVQHGTPLVKAQKRRIAKHAAVSPSNPQVLRIANDTQMLNPHAQLRIRLVQQGCSEAEVDHAMEIMWERGLPYDDFEQVLAFLREQRNASNDSKMQHHCPPEEETKTASTAESNSTASPSTSTANDDHQRTDQSVDPAEAHDEIDLEGFLDDADAFQVRRHRKSTVHPLNMSSKLDLVADYENLADAAFALSEWVAKAANSHEIHELCAAHKARALPTVMRRAIAETPDDTKFMDSVLPAMLHLIGSIFLNVGMSSSAASATRRSLEVVVKLARQATLKKEDPEQLFADRVARYVVSRISESIRDLESHGSNDEGVDLILRLEDEIESLASSLATGEGGVVDLISKRDANKIAAEKSSAVVGVAMSTSFHGLEIPVGGDDDAVVDKEDILVSLVGKSGLRSISNNKKVLEDLSARISSLTTLRTAECTRLRSDLETFHAERVLVAQRMEELRLAMKQLEEDDLELCQRIDETEVQLHAIDIGNNAEVNDLVVELRETQQMVDYEETIEHLADGLKIYEESLKKAVTVSNIFENCDNINEFVPNKFGVYLVHVKNYFTSESACVEFIRKRVKTLERESNDLIREIEICRTMNMTATVSQMSDALSLNRQNISEDRGVINDLISEAQIMLTKVIGRIDQFVSEDKIHHQKRELSPLHVILVRGIAGTAEMMGLEDIDRLKAYMPNSNDDFPTVVTTSYDENDEMDGSDTDLEVCTSDGVDYEIPTRSLELDYQEAENDMKSRKISPADSETQSVPHTEASSAATEVQTTPRKSSTDMLIRRLTWATPPVKSAQKPAVRSLRAIQMEELSCRGSGR